MIAQAQRFYDKNLCWHWDLNPRPSDSHPLARALFFLKGFVSLRSITLPLLVATAMWGLGIGAQLFVFLGKRGLAEQLKAKQPLPEKVTNNNGAH